MLAPLPLACLTMPDERQFCPDDCFHHSIILLIFWKKCHRFSEDPSTLLILEKKAGNILRSMLTFLKKCRELPFFNLRYIKFMNT